MKVFIQNNIYENVLFKKKTHMKSVAYFYLLQMQYQYFTIIILVILNEIIEWMYQKVIK